MSREIIQISFTSEPVLQNMKLDKDLHSWLIDRTTEDSIFQESILLAHAIDGLIWGIIRDGELITSHDINANISPPLRSGTLQQLRLFNAEGEIRLWQAENKDCFNAVKITDITDDSAAAVDEVQLLWGTYATPLAKGFTLLEDGSQGLRHVVPPLKNICILNGGLGARSHSRIGRVHLRVRHYLTEDQYGVNTVGISRFTEIGFGEYDEEGQQL